MGLLNYRKPGGPADGPRGLLGFLLDPDGMPDGYGADDPAPASGGAGPASGDGFPDPHALPVPNSTGTATANGLVQLAANGPQGPGVTTAKGVLCFAPGLSARDNTYIARNLPAVAPLARRYGVDPALPLGVGTESSFGTKGTYLRTGDVYGMTGGSTDHMTYVKSPEDDASKFFGRYGQRFKGSGRDAARFINALQGLNAKGDPVAGWSRYNTKDGKGYAPFIQHGINQMKWQLPIYLQACPQ